MRKLWGTSSEENGRELGDPKWKEWEERKDGRELESERTHFRQHPFSHESHSESVPRTKIPCRTVVYYKADGAR